jgi:transcriptional regulator with XRE-family HTH domain
MVEAREAAELTQVQMAQLMNADQTKVSRFELGKVPTLPALLATIALYCEIVGCDWTTILEPYFETDSESPASARPAGRRVEIGQAQTTAPLIAASKPRRRQPLQAAS